MINTVIFGSFNHAKVLIDAMEEIGGFNIVGLLDIEVQQNKTVFDYPVIGNDTNLPDVIDNYGLLDGFVAVGDNKLRYKIVSEISSQFPDFSFPAVIHPKANVSSRATIADGSFIAAGATVCADAHIGAHAIVNTNASVDHDCIMEAFSSVGPNAVLGGQVLVKEGAQVGLGSSTIQGINIGEWSVLGAGAVAVRDVPSFSVCIGVPARPCET